MAPSGLIDGGEHRRQAGGAAEQRGALTNDGRFANHAARTLLKELFSCPIRHLPAAASGVLTTTTHQLSPSETGTVSGCSPSAHSTPRMACPTATDGQPGTSARPPSAALGRTRIGWSPI